MPAPLHFSNTLLNILAGVAVFAGLGFHQAAHADILELKNGSVLNGKYAGGTAGTVRFDAGAGMQVLESSQVMVLTFTTPVGTVAPAAPAPVAPVVSAVASAPATVTLPAGTTLLVRMMDSISSQNKAGAHFSTKLEYDLVVNSVKVVPAGTTIYGKVQSSTQASLASADAKAPSPLRSAGAVHDASERITVWDRRSTKTDLVTGRPVPDETRRVPLFTYTNPRPAERPVADFIVGNPPFIGPARMREDLGDGYAETLRATYPAMPESADFVLYWWHKAATLVRAGKAKRFGRITTNSLRQTFARRVVQMHLHPEPESNARPLPGPLPRGEGETSPSSRTSERVRTSPARDAIPPLQSLAHRMGEGGRRPGEGLGLAGVRAGNATKPVPLSLLFAIPDHPWVDTAEGAAVRIAMTVGAAGEYPGELLEVTGEEPQPDGSEKVSFQTHFGTISADLTTGADVSSAVSLGANDGLSCPVFAAYGWPVNLTDAEILERLVALNAERAAEEKRGVIHWLRPEYQTRSQKPEARRN